MKTAVCYHFAATIRGFTVTDITCERPGGMELTKRALEIAKIKKGGVIADIGCGEGATVVYLNKSGYNAIGVDKEGTKCESQGALCVEGDMKNLPIETNMLDGLLYECSMSLVDQIDTVLQESARVLRIGGRVIITDLYSTGKTLSGKINIRTKDMLEKALTKQGFEVMIFEDCAQILKSYIAQCIIEGNAVCGVDFKKLKEVKPSYCLIVARLIKKDVGSSPVLYWEVSEHTKAQRAIKAAIRATKSPFYRELYKGIDLEGIDTLEGFRKLPFISQDDIDKSEALLTVPPSEISRIVTLSTSGTKRKKRILFGEVDLESTVNFFARGMSELVTRGDSVTVFMRDGENTIASLLREGLAEIGVSCMSCWEIEDLHQAYIAAKEAAAIVAQPAFARALCMLYPNLRPRSVLLSADYIPLSTVKKIEEIWQTKVYSHYGLTETGYGFAVDCRCQDGMHMRDGEFLVEIIDPITNLPVENGGRGEIVLTTLSSRAMPLIRYKTGDEGYIIEGVCKCGVTAPRLSHVKGRMYKYREMDHKTVLLIEIEEALGGLDIIFFEALLKEGCLEVGIFAKHYQDVAFLAKEMLEGLYHDVKIYEMKNPIIKPNNKKRLI